MSKANFPPQAFTKAELTKAFQWLQQQPESLKNKIGSSDALMSTYRRAQVYGNEFAVSDAPVSGKNFKSELKDLAQKMGNFEDEKQPQKASITPDEKVKPTEPPPSTNPKPEFAAETVKFVSKPSQPSLELDHLSRQRLQELKFQLNLGSESETLRLAITVAYHRLKDML